MTRRVPDPAEVGTLLRSYRLERNLSQEFVGFRSGLDRTYIGLIERGQRKPTVDAVTRILNVFGIGWREFGTQLEQLSDAPSAHEPS